MLLFCPGDEQRLGLGEFDKHIFVMVFFMSLSIFYLCFHYYYSVLSVISCVEVVFACRYNRV